MRRINWSNVIVFVLVIAGIVLGILGIPGAIETAVAGVAVAVLTRE